MIFEFSPARRRGLIIHILSILFLSAGIAACLWLAVQQQVGVNFVLLILLAVILFIPLPLLLYRGYALLTARYTIERDGLRLRWGLRAEDIPLHDIEWLRPVTDLAIDLPSPRLSGPGALIGIVNLRDFGPVEFLASTRKSLLLLATPARVYAISPADPIGFLNAFRTATEMGSLTPLGAYSSRPVAFLVRVWNDRSARWLVLAGAVLTLGLFILSGLIIPTRETIGLSFNAAGQRVDPGPAARLLLLPVLGAFAYVADLAGGLFFYHKEADRPVAYLLWAGAVITSALLFLAAILLL